MPNRSPEEQRLLEKAGRYMPGGNTGNLHLNPEQDFLVAGGKGSHCWDVSGNEYVDWLMGSGPMLLGHAHPHVVEAVIKTVEQGSTFFANNDKAVMLAEAAGGSDSLRREDAFHHQRHRRLLPGHAHQPGPSPAGKRC